MSELIPVWHGALWRTYPAPVLASPGPPQAPKSRATREDVWCATSDTWQSTTQLVLRSGCGDKSTRTYLGALVREGRLEMQETRTRAQRGGAPARWYRRRQDSYLADGQWWSTTTVAAAIGLSDVRTVVHLTHGVTTGLFERREATNCRRPGRRGYLYRLSQTNTQTDTLTETQDHDPTNDPDHPCA